MYFLFNIYSIFIEIYLLINIIIILLYGVFFSTSRNFGYPLLSKNINNFVNLILVYSLILLQYQISLQNICWNYLILTNTFSYIIKYIIIILTFFWSIYALNYNQKNKIQIFEIWILILFSTTAFLFVIQSCDLLSLYLSIEYQSLILYILASSKRNSEFVIEAGLKYFILGAFASTFFLFGCSLIYGQTGLTNLLNLKSFFLLEYSNNYQINTGFILLISALFFKVGAAPFHIWTPDVYEGCPTPITLFIALLPKLSVFIVLIKIIILLFSNLIYIWREILFLVVFLSLLVGTMGTLCQEKWKRFFAFSSISHMGFIFLGFFSGDNLGLFSVLLYLLVYLITIFVFVLIFSHIKKYKNYHNFKQIRYLKEISSLSKQNPTLAFSLSVLLFSMAGIPPFGGFFIKFYILLSILTVKAIGISLIVIIFSCISCFYYLRLIKNMYFITKNDWCILENFSKKNSFLLGILIYFIFFFIFDLELLNLIIITMIVSFLI
uniref:Nad2 n=1 Tax=Pterocladiophila hemisphaerica TaxID=2712948 RepID=A0A6M3WWG4_9FLOR|nr:Nad2 [Pterocladiophila hemisphaerica]